MKRMASSVMRGLTRLLNPSNRDQPFVHLALVAPASAAVWFLIATHSDRSTATTMAILYGVATWVALGVDE